ncbi:MAG TPA: LamG domain-containing protein [Gemmatimonadales bacterium]|nr:LamG domain-containing protein [Gemmatimonadales bacterium]
MDADLRHGLVAEYLFRGSAEDTSGHGRHGVVNGATLTADRFGVPDSAYRFDGIDDAIGVSPPPPLGPDAMSVSVWACYDRRKLAGWSNCIVAQDDGVDENHARRVFQLSTWNRHTVWHRMTCTRDPECKRWIRFGEWYHLVATCANGRHTLYLDGVLQDSVEAGFWIHPDQPLHIGRKGTIEPHFFFRGAIDDLRLYDRALSGHEVLELFREGGFVKPAPGPGTRSADPISGRWGQHGVNFLDLKLAEDGSIRGQVMNGQPERRAEVAAGSFDRNTGALRLEGTAPHHKTGELLPYLIEGLLDQGVVTVTAHFGNFSGNFTLTRNGARWPWRYRLARSVNRLMQRVLGLRQFDDG